MIFHHLLTPLSLHSISIIIFYIGFLWYLIVAYKVKININLLFSVFALSSSCCFVDYYFFNILVYHWYCQFLNICILFYHF